MATILLVEDETAIRQGMVLGLQSLNHTVIAAENFVQGKERALHGTFDLALLDIQLPDGDGLTLLKLIRQSQPRLPIIMVTARGTEDDRIAGLDHGADDYVVKPFNLQELRARIDAVLRRSAERPLPQQHIQLPHAEIDLQRACVVDEAGHCTVLSERDVAILHFLVSQSPRIISRQELFDHIWGVGGDTSHSRSVDMHMARLRDKIADHDGAHIVTVRGRGYYWQTPQMLIK